MKCRSFGTNAQVIDVMNVNSSFSACQKFLQTQFQNNHVPAYNHYPILSPHAIATWGGCGFRRRSAEVCIPGLLTEPLAEHGNEERCHPGGGCVSDLPLSQKRSPLHRKKSTQSADTRSLVSFGRVWETFSFSQRKGIPISNPPLPRTHFYHFRTYF